MQIGCDIREREVNLVHVVEVALALRPYVEFINDSGVWWIKQNAFHSTCMSMILPAQSPPSKNLEIPIFAILWRVDGNSYKPILVI